MTDAPFSNQPLASLSDEGVDESGLTRLVVRGEVDATNADRIERQILEAMHASAGVSIDLTAVEYFDSQGVRVIANVTRRARLDGRELRVVAPADSIAGEVLAIAGLIQA